MARVDKCVKCGSTAVAQRGMVADVNENMERDLKLGIDAQPSAVVFKKSVRSAVHASVCASCG